MKSRLNWWIAGPALGLGILLGYLGWLVTDASCRLDATTALASGCPLASTLVGLGSFVIATWGVGLILSLVYRSLAEHRQRHEGR